MQDEVIPPISMQDGGLNINNEENKNNLSNNPQISSQLNSIDVHHENEEERLQTDV